MSLLAVDMDYIKKQLDYERLCDNLQRLIDIVDILTARVIELENKE